MERNKRALVITGGSLIDAVGIDDLGTFDVIVAADSGVDAAHGMGLDPHVVVGDFDSVTEAALDYARRAGAMVIPAPRDKDFTDTELALDHAASMDVAEIVLLSSGGGRLDHGHGMLSCLTSPELRHVAIEAVIGAAHVTVVHGAGARRITRRDSEIVAIHAMNGPARGITTSGLRWNLNDETLQPWMGRGVSNEMTAEHAEVFVRDGTLIIVQPLAYDQPRPKKKMNGVFE